MKKLLAVILTAALILTGCGSSAESKIIEDSANWDNIVVSSRNGVEVNLSEYAYWFYSSQRSLEQSAMDQGYTTAEISALWTDAEIENLHAMSAADSRQYAELLSLANNAGVVLDTDEEAEITLMVDGVVSSLGVENPADTDKSFLETFGLSIPQMTDAYKGITLINKYLMVLQESTDFSDDELKQIFDDQPDYYGNNVIVRHVLILCNDGMPEDDQKAAKEKADEIMTMLEDGADIGELAGEYSEDGGSSDNNGEYVFGRGEMVAEFEDWSFSAEVGDQGMVKTTYGYHIMEFMGEAGFDDVKETIRYEAIGNKINDIVNEAQTNATLEWETDDETINSLPLLALVG